MAGKGNTRNLKPFKPGQSGNPGGRPKAARDVVEAARLHTTEAVKTLAAVMGDKNASDAARVSAANSLLDRAWGKAESTVKIKDARDVRDLSEAELLAIASGNGAVAAQTCEDEPSQIH